MIIRFASTMLRFGGLLAVILGLFFWAGFARKLIPLHIALGLLVVLSLWLIGIDQAFAEGGSRLMAISAFVIGLIILIVGIMQTSLLIGPLHWIIQVVHLLLGMLAVGIGQVGAVRAKKVALAPAVS